MDSEKIEDKYYATCCCSYPPGFCAGSKAGMIRAKVLAELEKQKKEYTGDNVILTLEYLGLIR